MATPMKDRVRAAPLTGRALLLTSKFTMNRMRATLKIACMVVFMVSVLFMLNRSEAREKIRLQAGNGTYIWWIVWIVWIGLLGWLG